MKPLQMVDSKTQYQKIKTEVDAAVIGVLESSMFIGGKVVNDFATDLADYHKSKHCIPCANGTDALQIAMMALGLQPGDEVITPSFTYIATVEVAALLNIKPIISIDTDGKYYTYEKTRGRKQALAKIASLIEKTLLECNSARIYIMQGAAMDDAKNPIGVNISVLMKS